METPKQIGTFPRWLKPLNRVMVGLQRLGVPSGPMRVIAVPGRKSGKLQVTPVSPLTVDGVEYVTGASAADWVKNARAAGWGDLTHGRRTARVTLHEVPVAERGAILREFPRLVPGGVAFYRRLYGLPQDPDALPDAFERLAPVVVVFRIGRG